MKILVLGGNGFIGNNLLKKLSTTEYEIFSFDREIPENRYENITYFNGNFENIKNYSNIFNNIDIVYHLISTTIPNSNIENVEYDIKTNLIPTINLLNICIEKKVKKIIYSSSGGAIYGNSNQNHSEKDCTLPTYPYGINKLAIEHYMEFYYKFYDLDYTSLRISNPYGSHHKNKKQGIINVMLDKIACNETIEIFGDGEIIRDYIYIDDVIDAFVKCINYNDNEKCFNICSSKSYSINELIKEISTVTKCNPKITYLPSRKFDIPVSKLDNTLAKKFLKWEPKFSIKDGIELCWKNKLLFIEKEKLQHKKYIN